ncbi:MAG: sulfatase-like hydrolase/transferase [Microthrixaceae bacterium]
MTSKQPNVLVIMTDEERYAPAYESDEIREFRLERMPVRAALSARGVEFARHYTASTACLPSRASLFTGQYPSLHGVRNTDGMAKTATDPAMNWLDPDSVPTMGDWFRAAGYETHYRGKWHISHAEMTVTGTHEPFLTNTRSGEVIHDAVEAYRKADRLDPFGFSGWIGPEPHGPLPANTGLVRDGLFAEQVTDLFDTLGGRGADSPPWLAVASFVNPHDIGFSGLGWNALGFGPIPDWVPEIPEAPSQADSLEDRPACQRQFREAWPKMLYPQEPDGEYRRLYYYLLALVDEAMGRILDSLERNGLAEDTIVVFTSDHGDLLGAHGGLVQKWYNAYEEAVHVPLVVAGPGIAAGSGASVEVPTSHVDLLPTLLDLIGGDVDALAEEVSRSHVETRRLVGTSRAHLLNGPVGAESDPDPIYFMTEDHMTRGLRQRGILTGEEYEAVQTPCAVESVIAAIDGAVWKLNHYYDPDSGPTDDTTEHAWELYDLVSDPEERTDRGGDPTVPLGELHAMLAEHRLAKRLEPAERLTRG